MPINRSQFLFIFSSIAFFRVTFIDAQSKYSETVSVLQMAYINEIQAHLNYLSYAEKAKLENYPGLAYLFYSFAGAESVHACNSTRFYPLWEFKAGNRQNQELRFLAPG